MTAAVTIYHNPGCSKSRQTMDLLEQKNIAPTVVKYLDTPPDAATLSKILAMLGLTPRELMRKGETGYTELKLDNPELSTDQLIQAMVENPHLIERPIVITGNKAAIGRPPAQVLDIL
uniref:Arsenate reductase n=1 Tax=uncultured Thiotrichaceae bacterium TaxID=298394 RepID=A0A6S6UJY8_9GAMM|nr:MAG: Arsenate reductase (EC [uncultured Thiotrichaceae bacterium]